MAENDNVNPVASTGGNTELSRENALQLLEASYDMYETSRAETIDMRKNKTDKYGNRVYSEQSLNDTLELMDTMQADIITEYEKLGGNVDDLKKRKVRKRDDKRIKESIDRIMAEDAKQEFNRKMKEEAMQREGNKYDKSEHAEKKVERQPKKDGYLSFDDMLANDTQKNVEPVRKQEYEPVKPTKKEYYTPGTTVTQEEVMKPQFPAGGNRVNFDEVSLPSKGECYRSKKGAIKVSHLVAYDENLIFSTGLYKNGTFLDCILENKIIENINPDELIQGDRDAIIIWLRAGGYGPMYPIRMTDPETGKEFETEVDLSQLNFKPFTLKGDENGYFDYTVPGTGDLIKFKFLTAGDNKRLEKVHKEEAESETATDVRNKLRDIRDFVENAERIGEGEKNSIDADLADLEELIYQRYKDVEETFYTRDLTNRLVMSTVSVNGVTDRKFIGNYIINMNLKDATNYRKFIVDNEPGVDYNIKVKRPDSLGGGYIDTFLQLDQFIFIY